MKIAKISACICAAAFAATSVIYASAATELARTDNVNKFDLGSDDTGGSGVELDEGSETTGKNWIKVVQSSNNALKLFEDVDTDINVTALAVTFEISDWSGTEFPVTWGGNIDFIGDSSTTWCGTSAFEGISDYTINGNGEYTLVCDLSALSSSQGKEGIAHMQTLEMVICDVEEGDTTVIEVTSARIYVDGETAEDAVLPSDSGDSSSDDESSDADPDADESSSESDTDSDDDSSSDSSSDTDSSSASSDSSSSSSVSSASSASSSGTASASSSADSSSSSAASDDTSTTGAASGIALAVTAAAAATAVAFKKKR